MHRTQRYGFRTRVRMSENTTTEVEATPEPTVEAHQPDESALGHGGDRNYRKTRQGLVVSDKMDKTVVVVVEDSTAMKEVS